MYGVSTNLPGMEMHLNNVTLQVPAPDAIDKYNTFNFYRVTRIVMNSHTRVLSSSAFHRRNIRCGSWVYIITKCCCIFVCYKNALLFRDIAFILLHKIQNICDKRKTWTPEHFEQCKWDEKPGISFINFYAPAAKAKTAQMHNSTFILICFYLISHKTDVIIPGTGGQLLSSTEEITVFEI